jgi:hypothetical protein
MKTTKTTKKESKIEKKTEAQPKMSKFGIAMEKYGNSGEIINMRAVMR